MHELCHLHSWGRGILNPFMIVVEGSMDVGRVVRNANICAIHPRFTSTGGLHQRTLVRSCTHYLVQLEWRRDILVLHHEFLVQSTFPGHVEIVLWQEQSDDPILPPYDPYVNVVHQRSYPTSLGNIIGSCRKFSVYRSINSFFHRSRYTCHVPNAKLVIGMATRISPA